MPYKCHDDDDDDVDVLFLSIVDISFLFNYSLLFILAPFPLHFLIQNVTLW